MMPRFGWLREAPDREDVLCATVRVRHPDGLKAGARDYIRRLPVRGPRQYFDETRTN